MTIPAALTLAMDAQFRELSNFITPPRAGKITAIEGNGQVRVDTDDPDGGDVLAWPLNGFRYAVDDVVYVTFAVNNPESALVLGSKGTLPALYGLVGLSVIRDLAAAATSAPVVTIHQDHAGDDQAALDVRQDGSGDVAVFKDGATTVLRIADGGRLDVHSILRALTSAGLRLEDDGGNLGIFVADGGFVGIGTDTPSVLFEVAGSTAGLRLVRTNGNAFVDLHQADTGTSGDGCRIFVPPNAQAFVIASVAAAGWARFEAGGLYIGGNVVPGGSLHTYANGAGHLVVVKTGVGATPQVIIPNGAGDVTMGCNIDFILSDGTSVVINQFQLAHTGTTSQAIVVGGSTWTVSLAANGQLSVARTAGSATATIKFTIDWI